MKQLSLAFIALFAGGCSDSNGGVGDETIRCGAVEIQTLDVASTDHPLGFSPQQALDGVPSATVPARWIDDVVGLADIDVSYGGGALSYQDRDWIDERSGEVVEIAVDGDCPDIVAVEVMVTVATDDGRLDERLTATLRTAAPGESVIFRAIDELAGSADPSALAPPGEWTEQQLSLSLIWQAGAPTGAIDGVLSSEDGDTASAESYRLVEFGPEQP
jgi:hypothetical protein